MAKINHFKKEIQNSGNNIKLKWQVFNEAVGRAGKSKLNIDYIKINGQKNLW